MEEIQSRISPINILQYTKSQNKFLMFIKSLVHGCLPSRCLINKSHISENASRRGNKVQAAYYTSTGLLKLINVRTN